MTTFLQRVNFVKYRNSSDTCKYAGISIYFDRTMPAFTIKANTTGDKYLNLYFPDSVKVKAVPAFNHKYILEAATGGAIEQVIGTNFFNIILNGQDLNVEVKDDRCLIYGHKPFSYDDCIVMIQLAKELIERNQTVHN